MHEVIAKIYAIILEESGEEISADEVKNKLHQGNVGLIIGKIQDALSVTMPTPVQEDE